MHTGVDRRIRLTGVLPIFFVVATVSLRAAAATVVVARPAERDAFVEELFNRLRGELRAHSFSILEAEEPPGSPSLRAAEGVLTGTGADAYVLLDWRGEASVVRVWVAAATGQPSSFETAALERAPEVPTILAVRTVDLLISALRDRTVAVAPPATPPVGAPPLSAVSVVHAPPRVTADISAIGESTAFGAAIGPQLSVRGRCTARVTVALRLAGPLLGAREDTAVASATLVQAFSVGEVSVGLIRARSLTVGLGTGAGLYFVRATGRVADGVGSIKPGADDGWAFAALLGGEAAYAVTWRISVVAMADALVLLPRPRLVVGYESASFGWLSPALALGVRFAL